MLPCLLQIQSGYILLWLRSAVEPSARQGTHLCCSSAAAALRSMLSIVLTSPVCWPFLLVLANNQAAVAVILRPLLCDRSQMAFGIWQPGCGCHLATNYANECSDRTPSLSSQDKCHSLEVQVSPGPKA